MRAMNPERYGSLGLLVPAALTGVVLLLAWISRQRAETAARGWLGALAFAGPYAFGQAAAFGALPAFPPRSAEPATFWLALAVGVVSVVESFLGERRWPRRLLRFAFPFLVPWLMLSRLLARREAVELALVVGGVGLALFLVGAAVSAWAERRSGVSVPLVLWWVTAAGSACILLSGSVRYAQFAGVLAACLGAAVVVALLRPAFLLGAGAAGVVVVLNGCFWIAGHWLSELPGEVACLLAAAPLLALLGEAGPLARLAPRKALLARLALASLALVPAILLAWIQRPPPNPYG